VRHGLVLYTVRAKQILIISRKRFSYETIDQAQNCSEKWMMEMISEKFYGTSEATEEILEPEEQTLAHVLEEIHARI